MSIQLAQKPDTSAIIQLLKRCALDLQKQHIYQWNENYPSLEIIETDILLQQLFVLKNNEKIIGTIVLSPLIDEEYKAINWKDQNQKALYIHRLAIDPSAQKKGHAQRLMDFAENFAFENKYHSIRLDTFSKNERNQQFYLKRGYQKVGSIFLTSQSDAPFYCYEKHVKHN
ncbi:MAG: GNAT family N-acetyltransferase [Flavobacteriaceae bacterium]|nr:MAG: GNAT family N-acetyltransferase [Flavobacteriaceae bacterium]